MCLRDDVMAAYYRRDVPTHSAIAYGVRLRQLEDLERAREGERADYYLGERPVMIPGAVAVPVGVAG